jgi:hypothetical protein
MSEIVSTLFDGISINFSETGQGVSREGLSGRKISRIACIYFIYSNINERFCIVRAN